MKKQPHISVIILNWNGQEDTLECLESLFKSRYPSFTVYIVDNASTKDELSAIKDWCRKQKQTPPLHFVQNDKNLGFAGGNNAALRKALKTKTDYLFTLNNDTAVEPDVLERAVEAFDTENPAGIIACTMLNHFRRTEVDNTGHDLLSTGDTIPRSRGRKRSEIGGDQDIPLFGACAGAALYSADMLRQIGLFDDEFFLNYEDADLSLRGIVQGWDCVAAPKAIVYHKINASIGKIKDRSYRIRSQRNQLWAYLHSVPPLAFLLNLPWILLRDLGVILISIISFRWSVTGIFVASRWEVLKSLPLIWKKRRRIQRHRKMSGWTFWKRQKSFISTYWKYFRLIVIKRQHSVMEAPSADA